MFLRRLKAKFALPMMKERKTERERERGRKEGKEEGRKKGEGGREK
jgi:hypothetical protein